MKIVLKRTDEQVELIKAMASRNREVAYEAQVALAQFIGPVLAEVINNAPTVSNLFTSLQFNAEDNPSIPLDLYYDIFDEDYIKVYSQSVAGGLPQNIVQPTSSELKVATYKLDSAVAFDKKYAAKSRLDVVSKTFTRIAQEVMLKQERTSANLLLTALAQASTGNSTTASDNYHVFRTAAANRFVLNDLNKLFTKIKRLNSSFIGGTPSGARRGLTDLIVSPEIVEEIRGMAYNPINTQIAPVAAASTSYSAGNAPVVATDAVRDQIFSQAGLPEFYGVSIMEILELGIGKRFNTIFDTVAGSTVYAGNYSITSSAAAFDGSTEEIVIGLDRSRDSLIRAVAVDSDTGSEFNLTADDQYTLRQGKIGYYGGLEEGRMVLDNRALVGLIV
tara:strand:+ start:9694 stop:10863 length:1170 start_codon:yes stop_codon:yes gene_type:complete